MLNYGAIAVLLLSISATRAGETVGEPIKFMVIVTLLSLAALNGIGVIEFPERISRDLLDGLMDTADNWTH